MLPVADRVSPVRSSALPSFRSAVLPCGVPGQVLEEVHADILEFRTDQSEAEEENPHVVLRALGAEGTLVFRARTRKTRMSYFALSAQKGRWFFVLAHFAFLARAAMARQRTM